MGYEPGWGEPGRETPNGADRPVRDAFDHAASGAARLANALARPVSLVRVGRKRRHRSALPAPAPGRVVACVVYRDGQRASGAVSYIDALREARAQHGAFVWLGLFEPTRDELASVAEVYGLNPLAVEDAWSAHQRPRLRQYDDTLLVALKTARYVEHSELTADSEVVDTGQVTVFVDADFVITVRRGAHGGLRQLRSDLEGRPAMLRHGPAAVLHAICDQIVEGYLEVTERLEGDIDAVEASVFNRSTRPTAEKVYQLKREILELKHAVVPLGAPLRTLATSRTPPLDPRIRENFRNAADHLEQAAERISHFDELLTSILQATLTQVTISQNEDMRRISAWVAIAAVPTAMAGIYGMNFEHMPELKQTWGYPAVLILMATICFFLHRAFKRNGWL